MDLHSFSFGEKRKVLLKSNKLRYNYSCQHNGETEMEKTWYTGIPNMIVLAINPAVGARVTSEAGEAASPIAAAAAISRIVAWTEKPMF